MSETTPLKKQGQERHSGRTANWLLNCKSQAFSNRKGFGDVRIILGVYIKKSVFSSGLELKKISKKRPTFKTKEKTS